MTNPRPGSGSRAGEVLAVIVAYVLAGMVILTAVALWAKWLLHVLVS